MPHGANDVYNALWWGCAGRMSFMKSLRGGRRRNGDCSGRHRRPAQRKKRRKRHDSTQNKQSVHA
jgi:hypothetical protein